MRLITQLRVAVRDCSLPVLLPALTPSNMHFFIIYVSRHEAASLIVPMLYTVIGRTHIMTI